MYSRPRESPDHTVDGFYDECRRKYGSANVWRYCEVFDYLALALSSMAACSVHTAASAQASTISTRYATSTGSRRSRTMWPVRHQRMGPLAARRGVPVRRRCHAAVRARDLRRPRCARVPARDGGLQAPLRPPDVLHDRMNTGQCHRQAAWPTDLQADGREMSEFGPRLCYEPSPRSGRRTYYMDATAEVAWQHGLWESKPLWPSEPSITRLEQIAREHLRLADDVPCSVAFFAEGAFNKLYDVAAPGCAPCLIRVTLPVDPRRKTLSEVATVEFVRARCSRLRALVPRVLAYDADARPYEWMITEKMPGAVLEERWTTMSLDAKEVLVRDVVACLAELFNHTLREIGNLYPDEGESVGRIVSMAFFWDQRAKQQDVARGPFRCSADWLAARLALVMNDAGQTLATSSDEDDLEEAEKTLTLGRRLVTLLPTVFPPSEELEPEMTVIHHDDLSFHNLLVDDAGQLTGIVDWECVSALPLWYACQLPSFLHGRPRNEQPDVANYHIEEHGRALYDEHLREWEQTRLRRVFRAEMARVCPAWMQEHRAGRVRADFELAVARCDSELARRTVSRWADGFEAGVEPYVSLRAQLF